LTNSVVPFAPRVAPAKPEEGAGSNTCFFDAYDGDELFADTEGTNCATPAEMRLEASRILMELASANISSEDRDRKLTVVARHGRSAPETTMTLTFART